MDTRADAMILLRVNGVRFALNQFRTELNTMKIIDLFFELRRPTSDSKTESGMLYPRSRVVLSVRGALTESSVLEVQVRDSKQR